MAKIFFIKCAFLTFYRCFSVSEGDKKANREFRCRSSPFAIKTMKTLSAKVCFFYYMEYVCTSEAAKRGSEMLEVQVSFAVANLA